MSAFDADAQQRQVARTSGIAGRLGSGVVAGANHRRQPNHALDEEVDVEDFEAFGWLRGVKDRAIMLQLRKRTGAILALPYAWIEAVEFDPSVGIIISSASHRVEIRGQCLNAEGHARASLLGGITSQRVLWISECDRGPINVSALDRPHVNEVAIASAGYYRNSSIAGLERKDQSQ